MVCVSSVSAACSALDYGDLELRIDRIFCQNSIADTTADTYNLKFIDKFCVVASVSVAQFRRNRHCKVKSIIIHNVTWIHRWSVSKSITWKISSRLMFRGESWKREISRDFSSSYVKLGNKSSAWRQWPFERVPSSNASASATTNIRMVASRMTLHRLPSSQTRTIEVAAERERRNDFVSPRSPFASFFFSLFTRFTR